MFMLKVFYENKLVKFVQYISLQSCHLMNDCKTVVNSWVSFIYDTCTPSSLSVDIREWTYSRTGSLAFNVLQCYLFAFSPCE